MILLAALLFVLVSPAGAWQQYGQYRPHGDIITSLLAASGNSSGGGNTSACVQALEELVAGNPGVLLRMIDASGKLPSNLLQYPTSAWSLGDYEECLTLGADMAHFCVATVSRTFHAFEYQFGAIGVCLPPPCNAVEIQLGLLAAGRALAQALANFTIGNQSFSINSSWDDFSTQAFCAAPSEWSAGAIVTLGLSAACLLFLVIGTLDQLLQRRRGTARLKAAAAATSAAHQSSLAHPYLDDSPPPPSSLSQQQQQQQQQVSPRASVTINAEDSETTALLLRGKGPEVQPLLLQQRAAPGFTVRGFLRNFSLMQTFPALMESSRRKGTIHCFDGLRTLGMMWWGELAAVFFLILCFSVN